MISKAQSAKMSRARSSRRPTTPAPCATSPMPPNAAAAAAPSSTAAVNVRRRVVQRAQAHLRRTTTTSPAAAADAGRARRGLRAPARGDGSYARWGRSIGLSGELRCGPTRGTRSSACSSCRSPRRTPLREDPEPEHRHVALDLTPVVRDGVGGWPSAYDACRAAFAGDEPEIVELGCLVSDASTPSSSPTRSTPTPTRAAEHATTRAAREPRRARRRGDGAAAWDARAHLPPHVRERIRPRARLPDPPGLPACYAAFDSAGAAVLYDAALFHRAPANSSSVVTASRRSSSVAPGSW